MNEALKAVGIFVVGGGTLAIGSVQPNVDCGPKDMCQTAVEPEQHTHEREPGPMQTPGARVMAVVSSTSNSGQILYTL